MPCICHSCVSNKTLLLNITRRAWHPTPVFLPGESPWTEEPGRLQSMWSQRIRHDRLTKHSTLYNIVMINQASLGAQLVKNLPAMQEIWVPSLGWEDLLKKEMATHSSTLA